jgi:hypothetical protein
VTPGKNVRCPACGVAVPPGFRFCGACGAPVPQISTPPAPRAASPATPFVGLSSASSPLRRGGARAQVSALASDSSVSATWPLINEETVVGASGEVRVTDPYAGSFQGRFVFRGTSLSFVPERTVNGTFLLMRREYPLAVASEFRVGRQLLRLDAQPVKTGGEMLWGSPNPGYKFRIQQILNGGFEGDSFPLHDGENLIGRATGDLAFPGDGYVSSRHAMLIVKGEQVILKDLNSSNGTFVRMDAETGIAPGDLLLIGEQLLRVDPS